MDTVWLLPIVTIRLVINRQYPTLFEGIDTILSDFIPIHIQKNLIMYF
jgi:hypothetical protein